MQFYTFVRHFEGHLINELLQRLSNKNKILSQKKKKRKKKGYDKCHKPTKTRKIPTKKQIPNTTESAMCSSKSY